MKTPANSTLKADWVQALNDAIAAGKIPDIPVSVELPNGDVRYPPGIAKSNKTCSWTVEKCNGPDDITHAPNSTWTIAFDDGPTASSPELYNFLKKNNQRGTHFMVSDIRVRVGYERRS
jgi:chitin deacetylase